jgi:sugar lactone lactonase YvrE
VQPQADGSAKVLQRLRAPSLRATMLCWAGPDLRTLVLTTAQAGAGSAEALAQPDAGHVWALEVDGVLGRAVDAVAA